MEGNASCKGPGGADPCSVPSSLSIGGRGNLGSAIRESARSPPRCSRAPGQPSRFRPLCSGGCSRRSHCLGDVACFGHATILLVRVRRFRCVAPTCPRRTFAEPLPGIARPRARQTDRLRAVHQSIGLALGGNPGARHAADMARRVDEPDETGLEKAEAPVMRLRHNVMALPPVSKRKGE